MSHALPARWRYEPDPSTGGQFCATEHAVFTKPNDGANPTGNTGFNANGRVCFTEAAGTGTVVTQDCTNSVHEHALLQNGTLREDHFTVSEAVTTPDGTFCVTETDHFANGQVQYGSLIPTQGACSSAVTASPPPCGSGLPRCHALVCGAGTGVSLGCTVMRRRVRRAARIKSTLVVP
jgi:hypothetical protein